MDPRTLVVIFPPGSISPKKRRNIRRQRVGGLEVPELLGAPGGGVPGAEPGHLPGLRAAGGWLGGGWVRAVVGGGVVGVRWPQNEEVDPEGRLAWCASLETHP